MDIKISDEGFLYFTDKDLEMVTADDAAEQDLRSRIRLIKGEYFLDTDIGVDYMGVVFQKNSDYNELNGEFKKAVLDSPYVQQITEYELKVEKSNRSAELNIAVETIDGNIINIVELI